MKTGTPETRGVKSSWFPTTPISAVMANGTQAMSHSAIFIMDTCN